ncbi:hypothetical protein FQN49_004980, partial [Arthroderma sp. PD_2]
GTFYIHRESGPVGEPTAIARGITHKARSFGRSHWINVVALFQDIWEMVEPHLRKGESDTFSNIEKCKSLARTIKARRVPTGPLTPKADLPSKEVSDELVDCYLRTTESIYRVLHVPSFRKDYEALFLSEAEPNTAFLVQVKLVLAIGAVTYDENFSLRILAIRWIYEAQTWLSEPKFKSRLGIQSLQSHILLLFAQEMVGIGGDPIWVSVGALYRRAIYMGLPRDPANMPTKTLFAAEMRRRIWNTILEVSLQSSLTSGGPPLFSLDDFNTLPPGNFDDEQIEDTTPKQTGVFSHVSIATALRNTLLQRLAIVNFLNSLGSPCTYEKALRLDANLRAAYKALYKTIQASRNSSNSSLSQFEFRAVDLILYQYLLSLHVPFFSPALHKTTFAFSRQVVVQTSLKIWHAVCPSSPIIAPQSSGHMVSSARDHLTLLTSCGSGFYRTVMLQAALLIAVELREQLHEEEGLGPVTLRRDLFSVLDDAKTWSLRCIEAGETNTKGYLLTCVIAAHIEELLRVQTKHGISKPLADAIEEASAKSLSILSRVVTQGQAESSMDRSYEMPLDKASEEIDDWRFMAADSIFDLDSTDAMGFMFADDNTTWLPLQ